MEEAQNKMIELRKELKTLFEKYDAVVSVTEEEGFLYLNLEIGETVEAIDTGYRDLYISTHNL